MTAAHASNIIGHWRGWSLGPDPWRPWACLRVSLGTIVGSTGRVTTSVGKIGRSLYGSLQMQWCYVQSSILDSSTTAVSTSVVGQRILSREALWIAALVHSSSLLWGLWRGFGYPVIVVPIQYSLGICLGALRGFNLHHLARWVLLVKEVIVIPVIVFFLAIQ